MTGDPHSMAEQLAAEGEIANRNGNWQRARSAYATAGEYELQAFDATAPDKARTRGILAVSAASLLYKGGAWDRAEQFIFLRLGEKGLASHLLRQLRELLEVVWDERTLAEEQHAHYAGDGLVIAMRGGLVGFGTAPLDQFLHTFDGMRSLFYRVTEWVAGLPFRKRGLPREQIREVLKARTTQPVPGSYTVRASKKMSSPW
jgi:hypothetical protein